MEICVHVATRLDRQTLSRLAELYLYDFSDFMGWDIGDDGRFGDSILVGCWDEPWRHTFLIKVSGRLAGFAIVDERSHLSGSLTTVDMKEFFVLRKYRRRGVGDAAATHLFDRFPGRWEIRELAKNTAAQAFWRKMVARYTNGCFVDTNWDDQQRGPVQSFNTLDRAKQEQHGEE